MDSEPSDFLSARSHINLKCAEVRLLVRIPGTGSDETALLNVIKYAASDTINYTLSDYGGLPLSNNARTGGCITAGIFNARTGGLNSVSLYIVGVVPIYGRPRNNS